MNKLTRTPASEKNSLATRSTKESTIGSHTVAWRSKASHVPCKASLRELGWLSNIIKESRGLSSPRAFASSTCRLWSWKDAATWLANYVTLKLWASKIMTHRPWPRRVPCQTKLKSPFLEAEWHSAAIDEKHIVVVVLNVSLSGTDQSSLVHKWMKSWEYLAFVAIFSLLC